MHTTWAPFVPLVWDKTSTKRYLEEYMKRFNTNSKQKYSALVWIFTDKSHGSVTFWKHSLHVFYIIIRIQYSMLSSKLVNIHSVHVLVFLFEIVTDISISYRNIKWVGNFSDTSYGNIGIYMYIYIIIQWWINVIPCISNIHHPAFSSEITYT